MSAPNNSDNQPYKQCRRCGEWLDGGAHTCPKGTPRTHSLGLQSRGARRQIYLKKLDAKIAAKRAGQ